MNELDQLLDTDDIIVEQIPPQHVTYSAASTLR